MSIFTNLLDKIVDEHVEYREFWNKPPKYVLLGIEELGLIAGHTDPKDPKDLYDDPLYLYGMKIVPVHDKYSYVGIG